MTNATVAEVGLKPEEAGGDLSLEAKKMMSYLEENAACDMLLSNCLHFGLISMLQSPLLMLAVCRVHLVSIVLCEFLGCSSRCDRVPLIVAQTILGMWTDKYLNPSIGKPLD